MVNRNNRNLGALGETVAAAYLKDRGYEIVRANYHVPGGEIDLIARDRAYLVFVEVKYRRSKNYGFGAEAITRKKQQRMRLSAQYYINNNNYGGDCRFDAVIITGGSGYIDEIEHLIDIF